MKTFEEKLAQKEAFFNRDYSWLKGYEVVVNTSYGETYECFVAQANPRKGLSIVTIDDPNNDIFCINKAMHLDRAVSNGAGVLREHSKYTAVFCYAVKAIQAGVIDGRMARAVGNKVPILLKMNGSGNYAGCAFK